MVRWFEHGVRALIFLLLPGLLTAAEPLRFDFRPRGNADGHPAYDAARGFGFEPGHPTRFSVRVAEGNHRVTLHFARSRDRGPVSVHFEQRRLFASAVPVGQRNAQTLTFIVNVRTPALVLPADAVGGTQVVLKPRETGSVSWDDRLSLDITPWRDALQAIEIEPADVPTLYLTGDSTVADLATAPSASWGQKITRYLDDRIAVANHADSGETLKSFVTGLRFAKVIENLRAGDWVMIQFGHNDQKAQWPQTYLAADTTYRAWLRTYIAEIRRRGATPLLVTSPERRNFDTQGRVRPTLADYATAMRAVAREDGVALLDLNAASVRIYEALGPALAPRAFADGGEDRTHHNDYGADLLARAAIEALRTANPALTAGLRDHVIAEAGRFDAAHPPLPE